MIFGLASYLVAIYGRAGKHYYNAFTPVHIYLNFSLRNGGLSSSLSSLPSLPLFQQVSIANSSGSEAA